jgi:hypothetical protein
MNRHLKNQIIGSINSPGLQSGVNKKIIPFIFFLLTWCTSSFAQQAYHGGSGDGYASAIAKNVTLDINGDVQKQVINFTVYPNPAASNQAITIQLKDANCRVSIYSVDGKILYTFPAFNSGITLPALSPGTYLIKAESETSFSVQKLIVLPQR